MEVVVIPSTVTFIGTMAFEACPSLTIYCEAAEKPNGWHENWCGEATNVVWGKTGN